MKRRKEKAKQRRKEEGTRTRGSSGKTFSAAGAGMQTFLFSFDQENFFVFVIYIRASKVGVFSFFSYFFWRKT